MTHFSTRAEMGSQFNAVIILQVMVVNVTGCKKNPHESFNDQTDISTVEKELCGDEI